LFEFAFEDSPNDFSRLDAFPPIAIQSIDDEEKRVERLIELNTVEQCLNLFKTGIVQRRKIATYDGEESKFTLPRIHPMVYDPTTGILKPLNVDFNAQLRELGDIYTMYFPE